MSDLSDIFYQTNLYEEEFNEDTTLDLSSQDLTSIPEVKNNFISAFYIPNNRIKSLPEDFFLCLPNLMWFDLRNNEVTDIPKTIKNHRALTHFLLQNNKITTLPNELGTVKTLKVLQLSGNPIMYPPREIINMGTLKILSFLIEKLNEEVEESRSLASDKGSTNEYLDKLNFAARSYNSVIDGPRVLKNKTLSVQFSERDFDDDEDWKFKHKCPKLAKSRTKTLPLHYQSAKYVQPLFAWPKTELEEKMKHTFMLEAALKKQKDLITKREKILQGKRNIELLKKWRKNYKNRQLILSSDYDACKLTPKCYPYDTDPEYMTLLTREDIEKDLPDKYRKRLYRRSKQSVPRSSNNDINLAMKIKKLFENLEAIDLNRETMTPRTEQKVLLGEIQKISEIKHKLMELSTTNARSVAVD